MSKISYVNGRYIAHRHAVVHIEDRGYQFADGVYEVIPIAKERIVDGDAHMDRLESSLSALRIAMPASRTVLNTIIQELIAINGLKNGLIYIQVTRGVAPRDHKFPRLTKSALIMTAKSTKPIARDLLENGVSVITIPDLRWKRCDIKSVSLLPNVLGKQKAIEHGAFESWQVDADGNVTEGTSTNAWIVKDGVILTRPRGPEILGGITRESIITLAIKNGLPLREQAFSVAEAYEADEAFLTSSGNYILPVIRIDEKPIGSARPGRITQNILKIYREYVGLLD